MSAVLTPPPRPANRPPAPAPATPVAAPDEPPLSLAELPFYRLSVDQYHRMLKAGVLREGEPVELLDGLLVNKMTHGPRHDGTLALINQLIVKLLPDDWMLRPQCAVTLAASEPEPDFAVVRVDPDNYQTRHPGSGDTAILIEVSDSSLRFDSGSKLAVYAVESVPEYWIVNVVERLVEVHADPAPEGYQTRTEYTPGQEVPVRLAGQTVGAIRVDRIMPRA